MIKPKFKIIMDPSLQSRQDRIRAQLDREEAYLQHIDSRLNRCQPGERLELLQDKQVVMRNILALTRDFNRWQEESRRNLEIGLEMAKRKRAVQEAMARVMRPPSPPPPPL